MTDDQLERMLDPAFLDGLEQRSAAELRRLRDACNAEEDRISYARRILQGRIDLLRAEALRREEGDGSAAGVLERLPNVLADSGERNFDPARVRMPRRLVPPDLEGSPLEDAHAIDLRSLSDEELRRLADRYVEHEREISAVRRQLFAVIDRIQAELAERYRTGATSVSELLGEDA